MSLFQGGKNAFYDPDDPKGLSKEAYSFIAGLLAHVKGMAAVTNPLVNSYKRLVPGYEAPCYLAWSAPTAPPYPYPRRPGAVHPGGAPLSRPGLQPLPGAGSLSGRRAGRHREGPHPAPGVTENIFDMNAAARKAHGIDSLPTSWRRPSTLWRRSLVAGHLGEHVAANVY